MQCSPCNPGQRPSISGNVRSLSWAYAITAFTFSFLVFTLIELVDHKVISNRNGLLFHGLAFVAMTSAAISPLKVARWPAVCGLLVLYGAGLEYVEMIKTAPGELINIVWEFGGACAAVLLISVVRLSFKSKLGGRVHPLHATASSIDISLCLVGVLWIVALQYT